MAIKGHKLLALGLACFIVLRDYSCAATDTLLQGQQLKDGAQLVSASGTFRLGFFSNEYGLSRYLGIWYNFPNGAKSQDHLAQRIYQRLVWVANQNSPILDKSGRLSIGANGNLKIFRRGEGPIGLTSAQVSGNNLSATLLDNGNFVLRQLHGNGSVKHLLWQSFDYPTDSLLPGMKLGRNLQTGHNWSLASGSFTLGMDPNETRQLMIWRAGEVKWQSGVWTDGRFSLSVALDKFHFRYFSNENERYFSYEVDQTDGPLSFTVIRIQIDGSLTEFEEPLVSCIQFGNNPYHFNEFGNQETSTGCVPESYPSCRKNDPPDSYSVASYNRHKINLRHYDCRMLCLRNCSCSGYHFGYYDDIASCQLYEPSREGKRPPWVLIALIGALLTCSSCFAICKYKHPEVTLHQISMLFVVLTITITMIWRKYKERGAQIIRSMMKTDSEQEILLNELGIDRMYKHGHGGNNSQELQFLNFESVVAATNNFASENKLGEGGFGPVYKGKLPDGQDVALKRLSTNSRQGLVEFKNEVRLIAKLQHNNLVRLVGCCFERGEKILIYEYMPNKSLDFFLFDPANQHKLDWRRRFNIVEGIAQGLLYLHKYSRLKVIHRDLKASNILLDSEMNPKISDFGMAKIFGPEESKARTNRVVGTYGYMPPEYAIEGIFSTKSDVFSFGVLLLEVVSGKTNNSFHDPDGPLNLIVYAWELWRQCKVLELMDPTIDETHQKEVTRCIHVGLLCVQENPMERPNMLDVVSMLYNETSELPSPNHPAFYNGRNLQGIEIANDRQENGSPNEVTITEMQGR